MAGALAAVVLAAAAHAVLVAAMPEVQDAGWAGSTAASLALLAAGVIAAAVAARGILGIDPVRALAD